MKKKIPIKTGGHLEPYLLDDCIEQFHRQIWPAYGGRIRQDIFMTILWSWLVELKALRDRCNSYQSKIRWCNQRINDLQYELECTKADNK